MPIKKKPIKKKPIKKKLINYKKAAPSKFLKDLKPASNGIKATLKNEVRLSEYEHRVRSNLEHKYSLKRDLSDLQHAQALHFEEVRNKSQVDAVERGMVSVMDSLKGFQGQLGKRNDPLAIIITGAELREQFSAAIAKTDQEIAQIEQHAVAFDENFKAARQDVPNFTGSTFARTTALLREHRDSLVFHRDHLAVGPEEKVAFGSCDQQELRAILEPSHEAGLSVIGMKRRRGPPKAN